MSTVYKLGQAGKTVKNLGWLLRNAREVTRIEYYCYDYDVVARFRIQGMLTAYLADGTLYQSSFCSNKIAREWLRRPLFRGVPLNWAASGYGAIDTTCDSMIPKFGGN